ncbi:MAG: alkaline shock response membrane anchor protein AmaP [Bacillota bacterium]
MKLVNRLLLLIISIAFMFIMLLLAIYSMGIAEVDSLPLIIENFHGQYGISILFFVAFILGAWAIYPFFVSQMRGATTSITDSDLGQVEITIEALKNMIRGVSTEQDGVEEVEIELKPGDEGVHIFLTGKVLPSAVIPEVTARLQRIVKSYIEETTGVSVIDVKVLIENVYQKQPKKKKQSKKTEQNSRETENSKNNNRPE